MGFSVLPVELVREVGSHLDPASLLNLAQVDRVAYQACSGAMTPETMAQAILRTPVADVVLDAFFNKYIPADGEARAAALAILSRVLARDENFEGDRALQRLWQWAYPVDCGEDLQKEMAYIARLPDIGRPITVQVWYERVQDSRIYGRLGGGDTHVEQIAETHGGGTSRLGATIDFFGSSRTYRDDPEVFEFEVEMYPAD